MPLPGQGNKNIARFGHFLALIFGSQDSYLNGQTAMQQARAQDWQLTGNRLRPFRLVLLWLDNSA